MSERTPHSEVDASGTPVSPATANRLLVGEDLEREYRTGPETVRVLRGD
jgi:hypothetical protein